jgi:hypothetical protein
MLVYLFMGLLICALFAHRIAEQNQAGDRGFWLGLFLGPAGVIAAGFLDARPQCPQCGGRLNNTAIQKFSVCPHCRVDLGMIHRHKDESDKSERGMFGGFGQLLHSEREL